MAAATTRTTAAEKKAAAAEETAEETAAPEVVDPNVCVVDDGTAHMGRAVLGRVCSAHALRYRADGTPRGQ